MESSSITRTLIRVVSFCVAIVLVLTGCLFVQSRQMEQYRRMVESSYSRSLAELASYVSNISTDLQKGMYTGTPRQMSMVASRLWRESGAAKSALSNLPTGQLSLDNTYRFLSQVGEYAMAMNRKVGAGVELSDEEKKNIKILSEYAVKLNEQFQELAVLIESGSINVEDLVQIQKNPSNGAEEGNDEQAQGIPASLVSMEKEMTDYPTLIYDGPFSDHLMEKKPLYIMDMPEITAEQAKNRAARSAGMDVMGLSQVDDENSNMPSYVFRGDGVTVGVSKSGGCITYLLKSREIGKEELSTKTALERAEAYLRQLGVVNMQVTYHQIADGICTVNFASVQDGVILYPDLIKVGIALDTGETVFYDARGYLTNHTQRTLPTPAVTSEQASESVSKNVTVLRNRLTLIPTDGSSEQLAYEFTCTGEEDQHVLVYINAENAVEERILLLLESDTGTLTK